MSNVLNAKLLALLSLAAFGCSSSITGGDHDDDDDDTPEEEPFEHPELEGAGGRDLRTDWPTIEIPFSETTKMLSFRQLRAEVRRVSGQDWVVADIVQWPLFQGILGGPDFESTFDVDRQPNQQKIQTIRKMSYSVCQSVINAERDQPVASRFMFDVVDPGPEFDVASAEVTEQVRSLYRQFFYMDAPDKVVEDSLAMLDELQTTRNPRQAWRGLCASYMASMRFLSY